MSRLEGIEKPIRKVQLHEGLDSHYDPELLSLFHENAEAMIPKMGFIWRYHISGNDPGSIYKLFSRPPEPENLKARLKKSSRKKWYKKEKIGLIFNGAIDNNLLDEGPMAYITLINEGFEEVYVLDNHPNSSLRFPVDDVATRASFEIVMNYLSKRLRNGDILFCYFGGHNSRRDFLKDPAIPVWGNSKTDFDFILAREVKESLDKINSSAKILFFPGCYGARFASRFGEKNNVGISASSGNGDAYGSEFPIYFFKAFYDKSGDFDGDGRVSIGDAFWYAAMNDQHVMHKGLQEPQIFYEDLNPMTTYLDV